MQLTKHHGLANDFLVVLDEVNGTGQEITGDLARRLCNRRTGIGADGLIHGAAPGARDDADVVMHLYNADGSRAEMSGNGIRCLGQAIAMAREVHEVNLRVLTDAGIREISVHESVDHRGAMVSVEMGTAANGPPIPAPVTEQLAGRATTVDVGNPHLVLEVPDPAMVDIETEGAWLEEQFPEGVNVEFITAGDEADSLELRVWERGVGVTQACGTGACAAAYAAHRWGLVGERVRVEMSGGVAEVELAAPADEPGSHRITLVGPAQHIATVELPDV